MRRFELVDGSAAKFWEIAHEGDAFDVRYGRIGTDGRAQRKTFASADEATRAAAKLVAQKEKKGAVAASGPTGLVSIYVLLGFLALHGLLVFSSYAAQQKQVL